MTDITVYCTDEDMAKIRPNILSLGVDTWEEQREEAFDIMNRRIIKDWYKDQALAHYTDIPDWQADETWRDQPFEPDNVDQDQLKRAACYLSLELAYLYLMKDTPENDGYARQQELFHRMYSVEISEILAIGINYDWDEDGTIQNDEKYYPTQRRLKRV